MEGGSSIDAVVSVCLRTFNSGGVSGITIENINVFDGFSNERTLIDTS